MKISLSKMVRIRCMCYFTIPEEKTADKTSLHCRRVSRFPLRFFLPDETQECRVTHDLILIGTSQIFGTLL